MILNILKGRQRDLKLSDASARGTPFKDSESFREYKDSKGEMRFYLLIQLSLALPTVPKDDEQVTELFYQLIFFI